MLKLKMFFFPKFNFWFNKKLNLHWDQLLMLEERLWVLFGKQGREMDKELDMELNLERDMK